MESRKRPIQSVAEENQNMESRKKPIQLVVEGYQTMEHPKGIKPMLSMTDSSKHLKKMQDFRMKRGQVRIRMQ